MVLAWVGGDWSRPADPGQPAQPLVSVLEVAVLPTPSEPQEIAPGPRAARSDLAVPSSARSANVARKSPAPVRPGLSQDAPPAPTAQDWAFAAGYQLKNSKAYRYNWGRQVRSMMGTAVEGPDQGIVRFKVTIAADGKLVALDTLWSTSVVAEQRARQAIAALPPLPPTPTGKPLVFEKTISFSPFVSDIPPIYKDDCVPDPPGFRNPFAQGEHARRPGNEDTQDPPLSLEECLQQLPQDSIEAEAANDQRQLDQWRSNRLGR
ncbi:MAG: energy transducer TonB [Hydrogenophaga sp.]|nr:energy transducer TonB [Hydrogenophaga sp.]